MGMARTDEMDSSLLVVYTHSPQMEDTTCSAGPQGFALGNRVNNPSLWEAGFAVKKGVFPDSSRRVCLACLSNFINWQGTETYYSGLNCA